MLNQDSRYLQKLQEYYAKHGVFPSFSGIAGLVGLRTTSAVSVMVQRLKDRGFLTSTPDRRLAPGPNFSSRVIADTVLAGGTASPNDVLGELISIDRLLIDQPSRTVLLKVKGDSMIGAGLLAGDVVIVTKGAPANVGEIVVALVDNEFTVKYLARDNDGFFLKPANDSYPPIRACEQLEIFGLVVGSFRKYF
ncbi:LexA family protein [Collimonas antrihumi]|uniref:LexA family protein n=1 Tax=Collimonas antrihumi TaxID=1940615 RepID=UPI001B8B5CB6|nr:S24 family peptidase [Collimonas antrihumi]